MQVTLAILTTMLTMISFLLIVLICLFIKSLKKGWIKIGFDNPKQADILIDELDGFYREEIKNE